MPTKLSCGRSGKIGHHVFGDVEVPWEVFLSLWRRYPDGITVMYLAGQIAGVFEAWPVTRRAFQELIDGKRQEREITGRDLYPRHGTWSCSTWYASNIYLAPQYRRTDYTSIFMRSAFLRLIGSGRLPAGRFTFAGLAYSREGEVLARRFGFQKMKAGEALPDRMPLYVMTFASLRDLWTLLDRVAPRCAPRVAS